MVPVPVYKAGMEPHVILTSMNAPQIQMCVVILSKNVTTKMAPMSVHVLQVIDCMLTWNVLVRYSDTLMASLQCLIAISTSSSLQSLENYFHRCNIHIIHLYLVLFYL